MTLLGLVACDVPAYETEQRQLGVRMDGFNSGAVTKPLPVVDAMVGSRLCPQFEGWYEHDADALVYHVQSGESEDDTWLRDCFAVGASGPARRDGQCVVLDAPGDAALELIPRECHLQEQEGLDFVEDRLAISSWATDEVVLRYDDLFARKLASALVPGPGEAFPPLALPDPSAPMRVIAGGTALAMPLPFAKDDPLRAIGYEGGFVRAVGEGVRPELQAQLAEGVVTVADGDRFALDLELAAGTLHGGEIVAVAPDTATSIELLVGYEPCERCALGWGPIALAQAIVRDAEGQRLFGAEVEFTAEGFAVGDTFADAMLAYDVCEGREGQVIEGNLRAQYRELVATANVQLECPLGADPDEPTVEHDSPVDEGACGDEGLCTVDPAGRGQPWAALGMLALIALRRRRR